MTLMSIVAGPEILQGRNSFLHWNAELFQYCNYLTVRNTLTPQPNFLYT